MLPRARQTVLDLARRLTQPGFLRPTLTLAATTAALSVGVGFLPVRGAAAGLGPVATGVVVSALAAASALVQPWAGRARDKGRLPERAGMAGGLLLAAVGFTLGATLPGAAGLLVSALAIGAGVGVVTPLTFAALAAASPPERLGQTMGAAEVGREIGDAGGPLFVGAVAAASSLPLGLGALAALLAATGAMVAGTAATRARD